jgi:Holliday junction resolvasome RuvABC endonuclease subunit
LAYGAIYTLCKSFKLVLIEISSQEAKVNASGKKTASKEEVIEYIRSKYKNGWDSKKDKEHEADAINIAECSLNSSMLKTLFDFGRVYEKK